MIRRVEDRRRLALSETLRPLELLRSYRSGSDEGGREDEENDRAAGRDAETHVLRYSRRCFRVNVFDDGKPSNHPVDIRIRSPSRGRARRIGLVGGDTDQRAAWS